MSERRVRKSYDREFKLSAIRLVLKKHQPVARVARDLGVSVNSLHNWKQQFLKDSWGYFPRPWKDYRQGWGTSKT